jgi:hypothetical protein
MEPPDELNSELDKLFVSLTELSDEELDKLIVDCLKDRERHIRGSKVHERDAARLADVVRLMQAIKISRKKKTESDIMAQIETVADSAWRNHNDDPSH